MTRTERRHHWQTIIDRQADSGLSKAAFCRQEAISLATFYYWAKKLREQAEVSPQSVVPLLLTEETAVTEPAREAQLLLTLPNGNQLAFSASLDPQRLQQFVMALLV